MASIALLVLQGLLPLLSLYLMKRIVDAATAGVAVSDKGAAYGQVVLLIGLAGAVALVGALCRSLAGLVGEAQAQVVTDYMAGILHAKSIEVDLEYYENSQYYDTLHRAQREAPFRPTHIVNGLVQVGQNALSLLSMAALLCSLHWGVVAALIAAAIPGVFVRLRYAKTMYRWQRERTLPERRALYVNTMLTGDTHAKEIRLFGLGPLFVSRFRDLRQQLRREKLTIATWRAVMELASQTLVLNHASFCAKCS